MNKLTRNELGLDVEGYKDFVNNLKQFAHVNNDFELYARDQLVIDEIGYRRLIKVHNPDRPADKTPEQALF